MLGEPVNLREQQDAVEFFMTLIDTIDEALKSVGQEQICSKVLGGVMSDQKICKPYAVQDLTLGMRGVRQFQSYFSIC